MLLRDFRLVISLTLSDLRYEWILSTCMVFALGAIFAPLFILLGLQEGIIGNMLDKLNLDPVNRLVTPKFPLEKTLDKHFLQTLQKHAHVVISSTTSHLLLDVEGLNDPVNTIPTDAADPLLTENNISFKAEPLSIVLSNRLANRTNKTKGDFLTLILSRDTGKEERTPLQFRVTGILPEAAAGENKMWISRKLFNQIYTWRKGRAIPELGLPGNRIFLQPTYDGIVTILKVAPSESEYRQMLASRMSFSIPPKPCNGAGWKSAPGYHLHLWRSINSQIFESDFAPLINRHHDMGYAVEVVPFIEGFEVVIKSNDGIEKKMPITILPSSMNDKASIANQKTSPSIYFSQFDGFRTDTDGEILFETGNGQGKVRIPTRMTASEMVTPGYVAIPRELAGKMNTARREKALYDAESKEFSPVIEDESRFFRAYSKTINELEDLVAVVHEEGVRRASIALTQPASKIDEVRNIRTLAGYMRKLYILIVVVSGISGFFAIAANVYAGVKRKRKDIAYLELIGLHPGAILIFPILKSLILILIGFLTAFAAYTFFGSFSDRLFVHLLGNSGSLTRLSGQNILILFTGIVSTGSLASLVSAIEVMRIEPGEYIRE